MSNATSTASWPRVARGQTTENAAKIASQTTLPTRRAILDMAVRLYDQLPAGALPSVIAERLKMPKAMVEAVLVMWLIQYRSEAATLRVGMANAIDLAAEAGRDAWGVQ